MSGTAEKEPPRFLALIPARGGSRRLPRKNRREFAGKPLLAWTIEAAKASAYIDRVVLSTDDDEIADAARRFGAEVPFRRPDELATDTASTEDAVLHALHELQQAGDDFDFVVVLQPTSPLRTTGDINAAIDLLLERRADAVIAVCETDHPPEWSNRLPEDGSMADFFRPGIRGLRSQDLPKSYRVNGAVYVYSCARLIETKSLAMDDSTYAYIMPRERSVDIDTQLDFEIAELLLHRHEEETGA